MTGCQGNLSGDTCIWGGYELYADYSVTHSQNALTASTATFEVPTISLVASGTTSQHLGNNVYDEVAAWIGLSPDHGGSGGLIQTGVFDAVNQSTGYELVYQIYGVTSLSQYAAGGCSNSQVGTTGPGDQVNLSITTSGSTWYFESYDYSTSQLCQANATSSETPYYAQFIVEAPTTYGDVQQIAKLSGAVNFEGAQVDVVYYGSTPVDVTDLYNLGWYYQDTLNQYSGNANTAESYSSATGTYNTNIVGYPVVTYQNSNYNWDYVGN
jgi:hypothetical protein